MRAGRLDRRITIEQPSASQSDLGTETLSWLTLATVWAQVVPDSGNEAIEGQQIHGTDTLAFRIRHRSDVTTDMRIQYDGTAYDILSIQEPPGTRNEALRIRAIARKVT